MALPIAICTVRIKPSQVIRYPVAIPKQHGIAAHVARNLNLVGKMLDTTTAARLARFLNFLEQDPHNFALLIDVAALHLALDQVPEAQAMAQKAVGLASDQPQGHALLGLIAARSSDYEAAADALSHAIALGDTAPAVLYHHAYALATLGRFTEAQSSAAIAATYPNEYPLAPALYIRVLHYLGEIDTAIAFAEALQARGISVPRVAGMLSTLYVDAEDFNKARTASAAALAADDNDMDAHTTAGLLALGDLNAKHAQAEFDRVLATQAEHGRALLGRGLGLLLAGNVAGATAALEKATQVINMRSHLGSWQALAWCYILQKDVDNAESVLQHTLELDRTFAETHGGLAVVALMRGDIDSATQSIKRASGLDSDNYAGKFAQSLLEKMSGNPADAQHLMNQILTQATLPDGRTAQTAIAEMLAQNAAHRGTIH